MPPVSASLVITEFDDYQMLVDAVLSEALTSGRRLGTSPIAAVVTYQSRSNVPRPQRPGQAIASIPQSTLTALVATVPPSSPLRGWVWLDMNPASPTYRTFLVSVRDSPNPDLWYPLTSSLLVLRSDSALAQADYAISVAGSGGGGGGSDATYIHNQSTASDIWTINHNMGKYPSVSVTDSAKDEVEGDVHYFNSNSLQVTFSAPFAGLAFLN